MSEEWFIWQNKKQVGPGVFSLHNFLTPEIYSALKHEIRHAPNTWHNNYSNRIVCENAHGPIILELATKLLPYLTKEFGGNYSVTTSKIYLDLSGSFMVPHFDSKEFAVSMQLYMPDIDLPALGTQFCFNSDINSQVEQNPNLISPSEPDFVSDADYTMIAPFCKNHGYINFNQPRKIHRTLLVPEGLLRESVHFNFNVKQDNMLGLESMHYLATKEQP